MYSSSWTFFVQWFTVETDLLWITMLFFPTQMKCLHSFHWKQKKCLVNLKFKISQKDLTKKIQWPIRRNNFLITTRQLPPKKNKDSNPYPSRLASQSLPWHRSVSGASLCQSLLHGEHLGSECVTLPARLRMSCLFSLEPVNCDLKANESEKKIH